MVRFAGVAAILVVPCMLFGQPVAAQNVNDFTVTSFDAAYHLTRDDEARSVLRTTEKITADFPVFDQNHGIERALPLTYDGHTTRLTVDSITNESGVALTYSEYESNDNRVLRIGDADTYVHGLQTYVITYTQHDVTRFFTDPNSDELYWDVNGTDWAQPMESLQATVTIDPSLTSALNGNVSCYQGGYGKDEPCVGAGDEASAFVFSASRSLNAGENVTFAIGFKPDTFAPYQQTSQEKMLGLVFMVWIVAFIIGSITAIVAIVWMCVVRSKIMHRAASRKTIIPEYLPPKQASVLVASRILNATTSAATAQILDLAVRHYVKIYQTKDKKLLRTAEYELEIIRDPSDLADEERRLLSDLFGIKNTQVGARFEMKRLKTNYSIRQKLVKSYVRVRDMTRGKYALFERADAQAKRFNRVAVGLLVLGILTASPLVVIAAIVGFWCAHSLWPLTQNGAELRDYLGGLKMYIEVAESERIKMLQSPEGAKKVGVIDRGDSKQFIKLYERVLPYAVLFGVEKEWMKQLGAYYESASVQPDWYAGNGVFNAVVFSSAIHMFSEQSTSYSSPSSSSSGGSGGSGFSGGGGGGGGGGGW